MSRGRGRGRGRGASTSFSGNLEAIGLVPGESAPPPILQPPSLFPALNHKPLPLDQSDLNDYLISVKQELRVYMTQSPFHLEVETPTSISFQRYSDKFKQNGNTKGLGWKIGSNFFPSELNHKLKSKKKIKVHKTTAALGKKRKRGTQEDNGKQDNESFEDEKLVKTKKQRKSRKVTFQEGEDGTGKEGEDGTGKLEQKLEILEKKEQLSGESEQSGGEETAEEMYDDEDDEEGTDYNLTYFDNGEEYEGGDDDVLEDGPVYN